MVIDSDKFDEGGPKTLPPSQHERESKRIRLDWQYIVDHHTEVFQITNSHSRRACLLIANELASPENLLDPDAALVIFKEKYHLTPLEALIQESLKDWAKLVGDEQKLRDTGINLLYHKCAVYATDFAATAKDVTRAGAITMCGVSDNQNAAKAQTEEDMLLIMRRSFELAFGTDTAIWEDQKHTTVLKMQSVGVRVKPQFQAAVLSWEKAMSGFAFGVGTQKGRLGQLCACATLNSDQWKLIMKLARSQFLIEQGALRRKTAGKKKGAEEGDDDLQLGFDTQCDVDLEDPEVEVSLNKMSYMHWLKYMTLSEQTRCLKEMIEHPANRKESFVRPRRTTSRTSPSP